MYSLGVYLVTFRVAYFEAHLCFVEGKCDTYL